MLSRGRLTPYHPQPCHAELLTNGFLVHKPPTTLSSPVRSNQRGVHPGLPALLRRHLSSTWQKPAQTVDAPALDRLKAELSRHTGPLVLDSFCGTGRSTALLAERYPDALVVGVDKSAHRLAKHGSLGNYLLLQAHCEAVWDYLAQERRALSAHYILYPNPWPKAAHLSRRVHGHPAFPLLLTLGGALELRSNWQTYVEEFGTALHLAGHAARIVTVQNESDALTQFEQKYRDSGHQLWRLTAQLGPADSASVKQ